MPNPIRWGVLAPGTIAHKYATDLKKTEDAQVVAIGSRALERAQVFAHAYGAPRAYGSYAELAQDPDVDAIYVATPHPWHKENVILCLEAGKAVLCEKPMGVNAAEVREMVDCARRNGRFLMEANWTRFLPAIVQAREWLRDGLIGEPKLLSADFGFRSGWNPEGRLLNRALAGGATLDVGVYVVTLAAMVFGQAPASVMAAGHIGETGVDEMMAMLLSYPGGAVAQLACAVRTNTLQTARIDGTEGRITIPDFWHATSATLERSGEEPVQVTGEASYHFEALAVGDCLRQGLTECEEMPLDESIGIAEVMDEARRQVGLRYDFEPAL